MGIEISEKKHGQDNNRSNLDALMGNDLPFETNDLWRRLVEYNPACIAVHSEGKLVYANPAALKNIGATGPEQVIGRAMLDFIHPDDRMVVVARIRELIRLDQPGVPREERMIRLDGTIIDVEVTPIPITFMGKTAVLTVNVDITQRKRAEKALRAASNFMAEIINNSPDAILTSDAHGNIISANKRTAQLLKYDMDELSGMNLEQLLPVEMQNDKLILTEKRSYVRDFLRKDRTTITLNISTSYFEAGEMHGGFIIMLKDLSEITGLKIIPISENASEVAQKYYFEKGLMHLFDKSKGDNYVDVFADQVKHDNQGLFITRHNPKKMREKYGLEKTPIVWLNGSDMGTGENCIKPENLTGLSTTINKFMAEADNGLVLLDGVEYLITRNGFDSVLKFIHSLNDRVMIKNCTVIVCIDSLTLDPRQYHFMLTEMTEFHDYK